MNFCKKHIFFCAHLIHLIAAWDYKNVDLWENEYPACGGLQQSPINLDEIERINVKGKRLTFRQYNIQPKEAMMKNNGHTVVITPKWTDPRYQTPTVSKDGTKYKVVQMHFHWGPTNNNGSEHVFDYSTTPLEIHIVHWNPEYGNFDPEIGKGILVIGVLFELVDEYGAEFLWDIVDYIHKVREPESEARVPKFSMASIFSESLYDYYLSYTGSLTTPPCSEGVTWIILDEPSRVVVEQMELFRTVKLAHGDDHNNRPIQSINTRELFYYSQYN